MDILLKKLSLNKQRLSDKKAEIQSIGGERFATYHGGWSVGYYEGRISALEDVLDIIYPDWEKRDENL